MTSIPQGHDVIRLRGEQFADLAYVVAPFDRGFTIPIDHEAAKYFIEGDGPAVKTATVNSTDEFLWSLDSFTVTVGRDIEVEFRPFVDRFRGVTLSDQAYLESVSKAA